MKDKNIGGRPTKVGSIKLKYRIAVKYNTADYYIIKSKAKEAVITPTEFVRMVSINGYVKARMTTEMLDHIRKISGMANNLNQIARKANAAGYNDARQEYLYLAAKIDNVLNEL